MRSDNGVDLNLVSQVEFVGPKTSQPGKHLYPNDWNNFGPAVGFAWALPWFGKGKTNVRGGYQMSYVGGGHAANLANYMFSFPGFVNNAQTQGPSDGSYFDVRSLPAQIPIPPSSLPMQPIPIQKQNQNAAAFDPNYYTPYIQNLTLSITREISRNLTLDVRYIGTRGTGLTGFFDLNAPDVFGEMGLMTGEARAADVIATSDVECFRLGKETFEQVLLNRPEIATELQIPAETVRSRLRLGRGRLRARGLSLGNDGAGESDREGTA